MNQTFTYSAAALLGMNKCGIIKPDDQGYYPMVLGGFDVFNSTGIYYPFSVAKHLFDRSGQLQRRIDRRALRGEYGHPRPLPGQTPPEFLRRVVDIVENNTSHHMKDITIDYQGFHGPDGRPMVGILGKVKPGGVHGHILLDQLNNPEENVCFSIRSLVDEKWINGVLHRLVKTIVTWDYVNEPGINIATKYNSPALESIGETTYGIEMLQLAASQQSKSMALGMENSGGMDLKEIMEQFHRSRSEIRATRPSLSW